MRSPSGTRPHAQTARSGDSRTSLIGRADDLAALFAVVERARGGPPGPRSVVLRGDPGVGKSTLLEAVGTRAAADGCVVLAGRADDFDRRTPYTLLADALQAASDRHGDGAGLVPDLDGEVDLRSPLVTGQVPGTVAERIARLLRARSRRAPCVLLLDDLHAADDDSVAVVANLARRLPELGCALLVAVRSRPPGLPIALAALLERLARAGTATIHELGPLAADDAAELVARRLGATPDAALAARLWESCRGNPFYLGQAVSSLEEEGALVRSSDGTTVRSAAAGPVVASALSVRLRLGRLGRAAERTALVLTVFRAVEVHDLPLVAELADLPEDEAGRAFDLLVAADFLDRVPGGPFTFSHTIVRDTLHAMLGPAEHRRLHRAIAVRLRERRSRGVPVSIRELARHVEESASPGDGEAAAELAEAGEDALPEAPHAATGWLRHALQLLPPGAAGRGRLLLRLAQALYATSGACDELVGVGREALWLLPPGPDRDWVAAVTIAGLSLQGRGEDALTLADQVLTGHDVPMPSVLAEKARVLVSLGRPEEAVPVAERVLRLGDRMPMPSVAVGTLADLATYAGQVAECEAVFALALELIGPEPSVDRLGLLCRWALRLASYGELSRARETIHESEEIHRRFGGAIAPCAANLRVAKVILAWMDGRWDEALDQARRPPEGRFVVEEIAPLLAADVHLERGEIRQAAAIVERVASKPAFPALWAWAAAGVAAAEGDPAAARRLLGPAVDSAVGGRVWGYAHPGLMRLIELEVAAGRMAAARERLATLERLAAGAGTPFARVLALRARGLVSADPRPVREALTIACHHGLVPEAALARLRLGVLGAEPSEHLPAAFAAFRAIGAEPWCRQAAAELRARGIPVPRRRRATRALTDTELRLAGYVAEGLTNREIAATMSLSQGTVATYLSRLFTKTGTSNRRQLGQAVRRGALGDAR